MTNMQKYWSGTNLTNRFSGWQIARENLVLNRKLGEGQYGIIYGGECNMERQGWVRRFNFFLLAVSSHGISFEKT